MSPGELPESHRFAELVRAIAQLLRDHTAPKRPSVIAIGGPVAVGKTTFSGQLAEALSAQGTVEVLSTDGFLLPTAVIVQRDLEMRKGYPETYDHDQIERFFADVASGMTTLSLPQYSHITFDIGPSRTVKTPHIVLVEGINALQRPIAKHCDIKIYLDADSTDIVRWYVERFFQLTDAARTDSTSFYAQFTHFDPPSLAHFARRVWDQINAPNVRDHIAPTAQVADFLVKLDGEHRIIDVSSARNPA